MHLVIPKSFNDAQQVADKFKDAIPVIINLQGSDTDLSKRLIDFASGLTYALDGGMQRIADKVFMLTPRNVEVSAEERARLIEKGFFNQSSRARRRAARADAGRPHRIGEHGSRAGARLGRARARHRRGSGRRARPRRRARRRGRRLQRASSPSAPTSSSSPTSPRSSRRSPSEIGRRGEARRLDRSAASRSPTSQAPTRARRLPRRCPTPPVELRKGVLAVRAATIARGEPTASKELFARVGTVVEIPERLMDVADAIPASRRPTSALLAEAMVGRRRPHGMPRGASRRRWWSRRWPGPPRCSRARRRHARACAAR